MIVIAIDGEDLLLVREYEVGTEQYELGFVKGGMIGRNTRIKGESRITGRIGFGQKMDILRTMKIQSTNYGA